MRPLKHRGKIYGAEFSTAQRQAMNLELGRQMAEANERRALDYDALVLYTLMSHYGWRKKRLRRFWDAFTKEHQELCDRYRMYGAGDNGWLAHKKLEEIGVNIADWYKEE